MIVILQFATEEKVVFHTPMHFRLCMNNIVTLTNKRSLSLPVNGREDVFHFLNREIFSNI